MYHKKYKTSKNIEIWKIKNIQNFQKNAIILNIGFFKLKNSKPWVLNYKLLEWEYIKKKYGTRWIDSYVMVAQDEIGPKIFKIFKKSIFSKSLYMDIWC